MNIKNTLKKFKFLMSKFVFFNIYFYFLSLMRYVKLHIKIEMENTKALVIIGLIWMIFYFISLYFLYTFRKNGKKLFSILFVLGVILNLPLGPSAVDSLTYTLDALSWCSQSAILVFFIFHNN